MALHNQIELYEPTYPKGCPDPHEAARMECGRLLHAAVINRRFLDKLLTNPLKSIEDGFCGEKFAFTREEKQRINQIRAGSLEEFSRQLLLVVEHSASLAATSEMAYARWDARQSL